MEPYREARTQRSLAPADALRDTKLRQRAEWRLPADGLPRVPARAGVMLRRAP